jgi:hypothetical protein
MVGSTMKINRLLVLISLFLTGLVPVSTYAHGGAAIEFDQCVVILGKYRMHFTAYLPETSGGTEYCWELPLPGHAIMVFDFVNPEMKTKMAEFRVVETGAGEDAASSVRTLAYSPPKLYEQGSASLEANIEEGKKYVAVLTLSDVRPLVLKSTIQVVRKSGSGLAVIIVGLLLAAAGAAYYFFIHKPKQQAAA